jgi:predicted acetyltransferase
VADDGGGRRRERGADPASGGAVVTSDLQPVRVAGDDLLEFSKAVSRHFYDSEGSETVGLFADVFRHRYRAWWVRDPERDRVVGNLGVIENDLSLPGGSRLPQAGITAVGVAQTMRRRGLLNAMMTACLDEAVEREEPVASLFASETPIYGRYGFGLGAACHAYRIDTRRVAFHDPVDVRLVEEASPQEAYDAWPAIFERMRDGRGGVAGLSPEQWRLATLEDPPSWAEGASPRRLVHVPGRGFARYRLKGAEEDLVPAGEVQLGDLVATDPEAEAALWQHVCGSDLMASVQVHLRPVDDALPELVTDRLALRTRFGPPFYVRVLDVARCLTARSYPGEGGTVLEVVDPNGRTGGRYAVEVGPDGADVRLTDRDPDLVLPIEQLPGVWLGAVRATTLVAARRVEERRTGAAAELDRLFAVDRAPWTTLVF